jgi:hypothetical protein
LAKRKAKRRTSRRRTAKRTKRKAPRRAVAKKNVSIERWLFVALAVIVVFALAFSLPSGNNGMENTDDDLTEGTGVQFPQETETQPVVQHTCKTNSACFLVNCKSMPDVVECVNVVGMETYYEKCDGAYDVEVNVDYSSCSCVDSVCQ